MSDRLVYPIDFEAYERDELIEIVEFLALLEQYHDERGNVSAEKLKQAHGRFREIVNSIAEEKRIDKAFAKQTGISIYQTMKNL